MAVLAGFIVAGAFVIYEFNDQVGDLLARKSELDSKILVLNSTMQDLQHEINTQRYAFERLNELEALTEIPLLDASYTVADLAAEPAATANPGKLSDQEKQQQLLNRIDQVKLSLVERNWLLLSIPNGQPLSESRRVTSSYGKRIHPVTGRRHFHYGIDISAWHGEPVLTTADGVVKFAGANNHGYGQTVVIAHNYGFITKYAHLSKILVKKGEFVTRGQVVGEAGNSGISTGTHLHYEIEYLDSKINPRFFIKWSADNYNQIFTQEQSVQWPTLISLIRARMENHRHPQLLPTAASLKEN